MRCNKSAFTLIELLVVVTIIVVLLALLVPAMDKAIYQAELAVCGANLKGIATAAQTYATGNNRVYPYRPTARMAGTWQRPNNIVDPRVAGADDRPYLKDYFALGSLSDPLTGKINLNDIQPGVHGFSNYELWFGTQFPGNAGMLKLGDRLSYGGERFDVLAGDEDKIVQGTWAPTHCAHPDDEGSQLLYLRQNQDGYVISRWQMAEGAGPGRGAIDAQHVFTDGSVRRYDGQRWNEWELSDLMGRVPISDVSGDVVTPYWSYIPRR